MAIIALHDSDGTKYPNLALMKLAAWHKAKGDIVVRFNPLLHSAYRDNDDFIIYSSKVFSWAPEDGYLPPNAIKCGTGYGCMSTLPDNIEHICPDYDFYGVNYSLGFLTRGCIRSCPWCIVPRKEGEIRAHADIMEFARHRDVVLMDNNFLALPEYAVEQLEKIRKANMRVDFNQGLDSRLIDTTMAAHLASVRWMRPVRLACDHRDQMADVEKAVRRLRAAGVTPRAYSCYVLVKDIDDALERVEFLRKLGIEPFAQPYREINSLSQPNSIQRRFARWVNHKAIFKTVPWLEYRQ